MDAITYFSGISGVNKATFGDEVSRIKALEQAQALCNRLEKPWERVARMMRQDVYITVCLKTCIDIDLFSHMDRPLSCEELARRTGAEALLLIRMLKFLAIHGIVEEVDVGVFRNGENGAAFKDKSGAAAGVLHIYDVCINIMARMPLYLQQTGYRNPSDTFNGPWSFIQESSEQNMWEWYRTHSPAQSHLYKFMGGTRQDIGPWTDIYPIEQIVEQADARTPLIVDVGGGTGRDISDFCTSLKGSMRRSRAVLQEQRQVISDIETNGRERIHPQVELMVHDFFQPQPVRGARVYFLRAICHDWADKQAAIILRHVKDAMTPGYSKLLLTEFIMPESAKKCNTRMLGMDLNTMAVFGSMERTEAQWRALLESVGLTFVKVWRARAPCFGIVEAELAVQSIEDRESQV